MSGTPRLGQQSRHRWVPVVWWPATLAQWETPISENMLELDTHIRLCMSVHPYRHTCTHQVVTPITVSYVAAHKEHPRAVPSH